MIKNSYFNKSLILLTFSLLGLTACSSDPSLRSRSNAIADMDIPVIAPVNLKNGGGSALRLVSAHPVSTVSLNSDLNSYGNMRRALSFGDTPKTVRLSDWLGYFSYSYPKAQGKNPFGMIAEIAPTPWNSASNLLLIGINTEPNTFNEAPANNIVVLVDISEGMDSSAVISLVKESLREMKGKLRAQDKIAFVTYSSSPTVILASTSGSSESAINKAISHIEYGHTPTKSSAIASLNVAYSIIEKNLIKDGNNMVIFITDGDLGTNPDGLKTVERAIARRKAAGIALSTLVFNTGKYNYQTLQRLADLGGGTHAYIDTLNQANRVITQQLLFANQTAANDAELQVTFNPDYVKSYRLLTYESNNAKTITQDPSIAGSVKKGQTFTAVYEIQMANQTAVSKQKYPDLARASIKYRLPSQTTNSTFDVSIVPSQVKVSIDQASKDFMFATAITAFALHIKQDAGVKEYSIENIIRLARGGIDNDELGLRAEFVRLLEAANPKR